MSCGKDAKKCTSAAQGQGAPEAVVTWAEGRGAGGHCPDCGGFLTTEGICNNPHTFSMSVAGGSILGMVDAELAERGVCPTCEAELHVAPGEEDWCMQCEELVTAPSTGVIETLRQLKDTDPSLRRDAAQTLGEIGDPAAIPALEKALEGDASFRVRWYAAWALGNIGDPAAIPALGKALEGDSPTVRWGVALALGNIGGPAACITLEKVLNRDKDPEVRESAIEALGNIGDSAAIPALKKVLAKNESPQMNETAQEAINKIKIEYRKQSACPVIASSCIV